MYHFVCQSWKGFAGRASGIMGLAEVEVRDESWLMA
jgi:hypothetical protein